MEKPKQKELNKTLKELSEKAENIISNLNKFELYYKMWSELHKSRIQWEKHQQSI